MERTAAQAQEFLMR